MPNHVLRRSRVRGSTASLSPRSPLECSINLGMYAPSFPHREVVRAIPKEQLIRLTSHILRIATRINTATMRSSLLFILATPLLAFGSAIPGLIERRTPAQCSSYYCLDPASTLVCCSPVGVNLEGIKGGCFACMVLAFLFFGFVRILFCQTQQLISRVNDNNNSRGTCDHSNIYCCDSYISAVRSFPIF